MLQSFSMVLSNNLYRN